MTVNMQYSFTVICWNVVFIVLVVRTMQTFGSMSYCFRKDVVHLVNVVVAF